MSRTDLIADAFTMMRNAFMVKKENVDIPSSKTLLSIMEILKKEGYIDTYKSIEDKKQGIIRVYLKYIHGNSAIRNLKRISRPGLRVYSGHRKIRPILRGKGIAIITTSKGIISDEEARNQGIGGEIIAYIW